MGQTSSDVTRTLPTKPSPEAVGNAGGSLIAVQNVNRVDQERGTPQGSATNWPSYRLPQPEDALHLAQVFCLHSSIPHVIMCETYRVGATTSG